MSFDTNQNQNSENSSQFQAVGGFLWDLAKIVIFALAIIVPFRMFVAEPFVVSGSSMVPNFHNRDYLVVDRFTYHRSEPKRGDVIVLKFPKDTSQFFIKRIVGLPGETVRLEQGHVVVYNAENPQGFRLKEDYLPSQGITLGRPEAVTLGSEEYFVLGDNRTASSDSRVWGILPKNDIIGKAWLRVLPVQSFGFVPAVSYSE